MKKTNADSIKTVLARSFNVDRCVKPVAVVARKKKESSSSIRKPAKEKISAILEKSSALRDHLPMQLLSVFRPPPPLPAETPLMNTTTKSTSSSGSAALQKTEESMEEMLRQIRNACSNFSLDTFVQGGTNSTQGALPVIATSGNKNGGSKASRTRTPTLGSSHNSLGSGNHGTPSNDSSSTGRSARWDRGNSSTHGGVKNDTVLGGLAISPEAERICHRIMRVQLLLFPSTFQTEDTGGPSPPTSSSPTPPSTTRSSFTMGSPPTLSGGMPIEDGTGVSTSWNRGGVQESAASKRAWKGMFKKPRCTFPILLAACRTELLSLDMCVAGALLTLLYNLLRATPPDQLKKVLRLCVKLGLLRICSAALQVYSGSNAIRFQDSGCSSMSYGGPNQLSVRARVCEAAALLYGLAATYDNKVLTVARVSRGIIFLATAADTFGSFLEQRVTQHRSLSDFDCFMSSSKPPASNAANQHSQRGLCSGGDTSGSPNALSDANSIYGEARQQERRNTLIGFKKFLNKTETVLQCFLHVVLALNILSRSPSNVQEMGSVVVGVSVKVFTAISFFLTHLCPKLLYSISTREVSNLLRLATHVESVGHGNYVASFVAQGIRNFESALFWSLTLINRLCSEGPMADRCIYEANTHHILRSLFKILKHISQDSGAAASNPNNSSSSVINSSSQLCPGPPSGQPLMSPGAAHSPTSTASGPSGHPPHSIQVLRHPRLVKASLHAFGTILNGDRGRGLKDLKEIGSLTQLTQQILRISENNPMQWLHYYHHLCDVHGVCFLPAPPSPSPPLAEASMNLRVPLGILEDVLKIHVESAEQTYEGSERASPDRDSPDSNIERAFGLLDWNGILLADLHPEWYSPELAGGHVESSTHLPPLADIRMPWTYTDTPPASTFFNFCVGPTPEEKEVQHSADDMPLSPPSSESIIRTLKHHISRLLRLPAESSDFATLAVNRHQHHIVYERLDRKLADDPPSSPHTSFLSGRGTAQGEIGQTDMNQSHPPLQHSSEEPTKNGGTGLRFGSNFECGNLQRAIQIAEDEYDLVLSFDTATNSYVQWFCFSVTGYTPGKTYRFNIVNMEKTSSTFNDGQRPLMLHIAAQHGGQSPAPNWVRVGSDIYYFPNSFRRPAREYARKVTLKEVKCRKASVARSKRGSGRSGRSNHRSSGDSLRSVAVKRQPSLSRSSKASAPAEATDASPTAVALSREARYYTLTFTVSMPPAGGTVFLANCYPFSYSDLRDMLDAQCRLLRGKERHPSFFVQNLCNSTCGLPIPIITTTSMFHHATSLPYTAEEIQRRPVCILTARVHPGESNSSWMINGILDYLVSGCVDLAREELLGGEKSAAASLLDSFVFKIVPMLNVDGVIMGNHRCSIVGIDLNRDYLSPSSELNPALYALKRIISHMITTSQRHVVMAADFHGHSRAKNFLLYGCTRATLVGAFRLKGKISFDAFIDDHSGQVCSSVAPEKLMPSILSQCCPAYDLTRSNFSIQKSKANTNRVVMYREFGIRMSYGVEASMMGGRCAVRQRVRPSCMPSGTTEDPMVWNSTSPTQSSSDSPVSFTSSPAVVETHYNQETYCAFGEAFMWSLHALLLSERDVNKATDTSVWAEEEPSVMRRAWFMLAQAGAGKAPPTDLGAAERHALTATGLSHGLSFFSIGPPPPSFPLGISQRRGILFQLLRGSQTSVRLEDCVMDGEDEEEDEVGDDDDDAQQSDKNSRKRSNVAVEGLGSSDSQLDLCSVGEEGEADDYDEDSMSDISGGKE